MLSRHTVATGDEGIGEKTIEAIERSPGRIPEARIIEALSHALDVEPDSFYEYPIAVARREARPTPSEREEAREREAQALRERAQQRHERPAGEPDTKPARRRRRSGGG